jgi:hypothetical protein
MRGSSTVASCPAVSWGKRSIGVSAVHAVFSKSTGGLPGRLQERLAAGAAAIEQEPVRLPPSPYSDEYETLLTQGHPRPAPAFGAPTLVWHVAIWPRRTARDATGEAEPCDPHDTVGERHEHAKAAFEARRAAWLEETNRFLRDLQNRCSRRVGGPRQLKPVLPHDLPRRPPSGDPDAEKAFAPIPVLEEEIVPFTLWWGDRSVKAPDPDAVRICVHPEMNGDYAAVTFYMDLGQRWGEPHVAVSDPAMGLRRRPLIEAVDDIRRICDAQLDPAAPHGAAAVDLPALPEILNSPDRRTPNELQEALKAHRNLLYVDIWEAFSQEMSCRLEDIAGDRGEVFGNFRGLIMSTAGLRSAAPHYIPQGVETASVGTAPLASFSADQRFGADGVEPNAIAKAYWPLVRRITPRADFREHVACGVMDWRAIYIANTGAHSQYEAGRERPPSLEEEGEAAIRVPLHLLSEAEKSLAAVAGPFDSQVRKRVGARPGNNHPLRYLLLTKHEPHPREIGRIAECVNTMGTARLFAFKDWAAVRDADQHLRLLGQELDRIARQWSGDRELIGRLADLRTMRRAAREVRRLRRWLRGALSERDVELRVQAFEARDQWPPEALDRLRIGLPGYIARKPLSWPLRIALFLRYAYNWRRYREALASVEGSRAADIRARALYAIAQRTEADLAGISARLEELALGAVGGLRFRLDRSAHHARELRTLLKSLRVNTIPTWVSYDAFIERGLAPAYEHMRAMAERLQAAGARVRTVAESLEAGVLRGRSAATRHTAAVLWRSVAYATLILMLLVLAARSAAGAAFMGRLGEIVRRLLALAQTQLPLRVSGLIEQAVGWLQSWLP